MLPHSWCVFNFIEFNKKTRSGCLSVSVVVHNMIPRFCRVSESAAPFIAANTNAIDTSVCTYIQAVVRRRNVRTAVKRICVRFGASHTSCVHLANYSRKKVLIASVTICQKNWQCLNIWSSFSALWLWYTLFLIQYVCARWLPTSVLRAIEVYLMWIHRNATCN